MPSRQSGLDAGSPGAVPFSGAGAEAGARYAAVVLGASFVVLLCAAMLRGRPWEKARSGPHLHHSQGR